MIVHSCKTCGRAMGKFDLSCFWCDENKKIKRKISAMKKLSRLIKKTRVDGGFSQGGVARLAGYDSGQIVSNIERGKQAPTPKLLKVMQKHCNLDLDAALDLMADNYRAELKSLVRKS